MIYWFSATGNTKHIAKELSRLLGDGLVPIDHETVLDLHERIIVAVPNYYWGLPKIVEELLSRVDWEEGDEVFFVFTTGGYLGTGDRQAKEQIVPASCFVYELVMGTNYIITHTVPSAKRIAALHRKADRKVARIAEKIARKANGYASPPLLGIASPSMRRQFEERRRTEPFYSTDRCISCGVCSRDCPDQAIGLSGGRPRWRKEKCQHCLRCINRCPSAAIEYGNFTVGKERYFYKEDLHRR